MDLKERVPLQLAPYVDNQFLTAHDRWARMTEPDVGALVEQSLRTVDLGERCVRVAVIGEPEDGNTLVLALPHQQAWKPAMAIRAGFLQDALVPNGQLVVLPNNGLRSKHYALQTWERSMLENGDARPLGELQVRVLETLGVGKAALTGYSMGAFMAAAIAEAQPPYLEITHLNLDEMPSATERTPQELQRAFLRSGGFGDQRKAIQESGIPVLERVYSPARLAVDYVRYGLAIRNQDNRALHYAMAGSAEVRLSIVRRAYPNAVIKLGHVAGSVLFDPASILSKEGVRIQEYAGRGTHRHPTADNPVVHALMVRDGLR